MDNYYHFWDKMGHQIRATVYGTDDFFGKTGLDDISNDPNFTAQQTISPVCNDVIIPFFKGVWIFVGVAIFISPFYCF